MKKVTIGLSLATLLAGGAALADHHGKGPMADADGNGVVTRAEAQSHAARKFARMDANKDGRIDAADRAARHAAMFDRMDTDKNGQISRVEFDAMHQQRMGAGPGEGMGPGMGHHMGRHGGGHMRGHHGGMMMNMADANNDGSVSEAEFTAGALQGFDRADANKDGQTTSEERQAAREAMRAQWREHRHGSPESAPKG